MNLKRIFFALWPDHRQRERLRDFIGGQARHGQVFLRRGSATVSLDLARFDLGRAAVVVVPGDAFAYGGAEASDARVFRSLLNLRGALAGVPAGSQTQPAGTRSSMTSAGVAMTP